VAQRALVVVVDDDESVRESLPDLLVELGYEARAFDSATAFLESQSVAGAAALLLDVAMPEMSGPDLQLELKRRGHAIPIVFITAQANGTVRQRAMAEGAAAWLPKPFNPAQLLEALQAAIGAD
jgi:FixJ family two-component response regulator